MSALVITIAPPASVTRQHINRLKGQQIGRELSTSVIEISSFIMALGVIEAHFLVATETSAICSRVVPYLCIWRVAGSENCVGGPIVPKGFSN